MSDTLTLPDFAALFDALPSSHIIMDSTTPGFTIVAQNKAHAVVAMTSDSGAVGKPFLKAFPDTSDAFKQTGRSGPIESIRTVIKTGRPDTMPLIRYDLKNAAGIMEARYWQATHYPLFDPVHPGTVRWVFQVTEDATDKVLAERNLANRNQDFEMLADNMPSLAWMADEAGHVYWYNARWYAYTGTTSADMERDGGQSVVDPAIRPEVNRRWKQAIKDAQMFEMVFPIMAADGEYRPFLTQVVPLRDAAGTITRWLGNNTDISLQQRAESNVRLLSQAGIIMSSSMDYAENFQKLAALLVADGSLADWCSIELFDSDQVLQQVAVAHRDGKKTAWAKELRRKQGPPDLSQPTGIAKVIRDGEPEFYPVVDDSLIAASAGTAAERKLIKQLGLSSIIIVPVRMQDKIIGALSLIMAEHKHIYTESDLQTATALAGRIYLNLTNAGMYYDLRDELLARTKLENELKLANTDLEKRVASRTAEVEQTNVSLHRSNQELQDFAYVASHDLQEPLRKIQAFGNLLETEYGDVLGEGQDYLNRMRSAAARMSVLIQDILSFSRVTTKGRPFTTVKLADVIREVTEDLEIRIAETHAVIRFGKLPTIQADAGQIKQVFQNLLSNAMKFQRDGVNPEIYIEAKPVSSKLGKKLLQITVKDNGLGFDEKYLDRIFAVFQRLHNRDQYEGTGIGLAVCRKIVERHGGDITASSTPGHGSTFIVHLPVHHKKGELML